MCDISVQLGGSTRGFAFSQSQHGWSLGRAHEKRTELRRRFELRNGVELFERRGEGVRKAPPGARSELLILRIEIQVVHAPREMLRRFKRLFDEGLVNHELRL